MAPGGARGDVRILGRSIRHGSHRPRGGAATVRKGAELEREGYRHSYDMLYEGERAHAPDAEHYQAAYTAAIAAIGKVAPRADRVAEEAPVHLGQIDEPCPTALRDRATRAQR